MQIHLILKMTALTLILTGTAYGSPLPPPALIAENKDLINAATETYKSLYSHGVIIGNTINHRADACKKSVTEKVARCEKNCDDKFFSRIKKTSLGCMNAFMGLKVPIQRERLVNIEFADRLNSGLYNDLPQFRTKLLADSQTFSGQYTKMSAAIATLAKQYSEIYQALLRIEFNQAKDKGKINGEIIGICSHLKNELDMLTLSYDLAKDNKSIFFWNDFNNKIKGYSLVANSLRPLCPSHFAPANYDNLRIQVAKQFRTLAGTINIEKICRGPISKEYRTDFCDGSFALDTSALSIISQEVRK